MDGKFSLPSIPSNLASLKKIQEANIENMEELVTGKQVNEFEDNPLAFMAAVSMDLEAKNLDIRLDGIQRGISLTAIAQNAMNSMDSLLLHMKGIAAQAVASYSDRHVSDLQLDYDNVRAQVVGVAMSAVFDGFNMLLGDLDATAEDYLKGPAEGGVEKGEVLERVVQLGAEYGDSTYSLFSRNVFESEHWENTYADHWQQSIFDVDITKNMVAIESFKKELGYVSDDILVDSTVLKVRDQFVSNHSDYLKEGSGKLTVVDLEEATARAVAGKTAEDIAENTIRISNAAKAYFLKVFNL